MNTVSAASFSQSDAEGVRDAFVQHLYDKKIIKPSAAGVTDSLPGRVGLRQVWEASELSANELADEAAASALQGLDYYRWIFANEPEWADFR